MSIASPPTTATDLAGKRRKLVVFHHSNLFYWWPVWLLGFILAGYTWYENDRMAIVPPGTEAVEKQRLQGQKEDRDLLILPKGKHVRTHLNAEGEREINQPYVRMSRHKGLGTLFMAVLLLVIIITNVTMRGLWSVFVILVLIMLTIIFYLAGWWDVILQNVRILAIHINVSGYLLMSIVLFAAWAINFFLMDRQMYMTFTPGQVRARLTIGGGETVYGTTGMSVQKERSDLFRHWILGFGSGDLILRPAGLHSYIEMPNVLRVSSVVKQIEQMIKEQQVVVRGDR